MTKRILSGMRPTSKLHLGHLLGVLENWKRFESEEAFYMIADLHALSTEYEQSISIKDIVLEVVLDYLASGLDPEKCTIFVQSYVKEHAELALILSMITPLGWLERCPTYKEQLREQKERDLHTYGFLGYPVLQAADILLYKTDLVPVGEDQLPHLELTREIARRFNNFYGKVFKEPKESLTKVARLPGLDGRKMSKTYNNCIYLSDSPEVIEKKLASMITDPHRKYRQDKGHPQECPVFFYHTIFNLDISSTIEKQCRQAQIGCVDCKKALSNKLVAFLRPIYDKRLELREDMEAIRKIIARGSEKAQEVASQTIKEVKAALRL